MKKLKILLLALVATISLGAWADVTDGSGLVFSTKNGFGDPAKAGGNAAKDLVFEVWTSNANAAFDLNQEVTSLSEGIYELSAIAMYRASLTYGTPTNCVLYATVGDKTYTAPIKNFGDCTASENLGGVANAMVNHKAYSTNIPYIVVKDGSAKIGMKSLGALTYCTNGYWFIYDTGSFTFKNVTSDYYSKLSARATKMLETAIEGDAKTALSTAISTYNEATIDNIEGLKAAINAYLVAAASDENPIDVTSYMANPSFDGGSLKFWMQDFDYTQAVDMYQPNNWDLCYSSKKVGNTQFQTFKPQTDGAKNGNCLYVRHRWGDVNAIENLRQTVKELPAGKYTLTVAVKGGSEVTDPNTLTLTAGANTNTITIGNFDKENYKDYSVSIIKNNKETNLDICYGFEQKTGVEQLYYIDDFRLVYNGEIVSDEDAAALIASIPTGKMYSGASSSMQAAKEALEASKSLSNYKALSAAIEIAKASIADYANLKAAIDLAKEYTVVDETYETLATTITTAEGIYNDGTVETCAETIAGLDEAVKAAKVADYTYVSGKYLYSVDLGTWNETEGVSEFSNEHWSGETHSYKNQDDSNGRGWNSSTGFTIGLNQDVKLPAGNYIFKACGRKSDLAKLELIVKVKDGDELGKVSDFPSSNNALGINKAGDTSFDPGDTKGFAHNGSGYGWQWRFVEFELDEETIINVAVSASATTKYQWVSFGDYSVLTNDETNIAKIAYNIALNDANLAIANDKYKNVTGAEKTELTGAINATPGSTTEEIEAATAALKTATENFVKAAPAYDNYVAVLAKVENLDEAGKAKFNELAAEIKAKYNNNTVTAEELADVTDYFNQAFNVQNPNKDVTYLLKNPSFEDGTEGWTNNRNTTGTYDYRTDTTNPADGTYTLNAWANQVNYINVYQKVILPKGAYKLSAKARTNKEPLENQTQVRTYIGGNLKSASQGLTYTPTEEYAWNSQEAWQTLTTIFYIDEPTEVEMGIYSKGENQKDNQRGWFQVDDFRLVYLGDATANMTITSANWGTFCAPFDVAIPEGVKAYTAEEDGNTVAFTEVETTIPAGTPVVVYSATEVNEEFNGKATATGETCTEGALVGVYAATSDIEAATGYTNYVLQSNTQGVGFYKVAEGSKISLNANRCYMTLATSAGAKDCVVLDGIVTGINNILNPTDKSAEGIYDLNGRKLAAPQKGINIINGVKVIVK